MQLFIFVTIRPRAGAREIPVLMHVSNEMKMQEGRKEWQNKSWRNKQYRLSWVA